MDGLADNIADQYERHGGPAAGKTLEEAVWLEEQSLGYPLNLMCSLYYEVTNDDPFRQPEAAAPPLPEPPLPTTDEHSPNPETCDE